MSSAPRHSAQGTRSVEVNEFERALNLIARRDVKGRDIWTLSNDALADFRLNTVGFVFQDFHLFPRLTTAENVAIPLILKRRDWNESIAEARECLEIVGLKNRAKFCP